MVDLNKSITQIILCEIIFKFKSEFVNSIVLAGLGLVILFDLCGRGLVGIVMDEQETKLRDFTIVDLNYVSLYLKDYEKAVGFYTRVFGSPDTAEGAIHGWRMGRTWLTLFPAKDGMSPQSNPRNSEFAIQVARSEEVDRLFDLLVREGATSAWPPEDTEMYEKMRFSCVEDPFGTRIDVYCPA